MNENNTLYDIAVVAMAARLPDANTVEEFWENLDGAVESIRQFSEEEMSASNIPEALLSHPDYVRAGAVVDDIEHFDAGFFGIGRREA